MLLPKLKHGIWMSLGCHPAALSLFRLWGLVSGKGEALGVVSKHTAIVIEGYPRSANTFAVAAFRLAQSCPVEIAHHLHAPAQVIWAARRRIPALVLIRKPIDAVASLVVRQPGVSLRQVLSNYVRFYVRILPYRDRYVLASFDEVIRDYGAVIRRVNARFGTTFAIFDHTDENVRKCYRPIDEMDHRDTKRAKVTATTVARPSQESERLKTHLKQKLEEAPLQDLIDQAAAVYRELTENSA